MAVEAPVAPAAPAAPSSQTTVASAPQAPAAPAAPKGEIHVTPGAVADKGPVQPAPKPGSAKDRMFKDLRAKAGMVDEPETKPETKPETPAKPGVDEETTEKPTEGEQPEAPAEPADKTVPQDKKKVSPWKLVDEHKAARLKAETELAELRKAVPDPAKLKEIEERAAKAEARAKELDEHIKYVDYTKSSEFAEKYQKPYEAAWHRWMNDLRELTVSDPSTGQERAISAADIAELVNMPLQKAREQAENVFGNFADDVMDARKEIRNLWDNQNRALEEAKKLGAQRTEAQQKQAAEQAEAASKEIRQLWESANQAAMTDEKTAHFFKPVEGDEEGNQRLSRGYEMADKAFSVSPLDPRLTPEQRAEVVRLHAAVRNRAAAFGRMALQKQQLEAQVKALNEEIAKYKSVEPGAGKDRQEQPAEGHSSAKESVFAALRKRAV